MSKEYWKEVLGTARKTLSELRVRRDELDAEREEVNLEIVQLEQVVSNLTPLVSDLPVETQPVFRLPIEIKLTDACREILKKNDKHMSPIEIRGALEAGGYDLSQHTNALASIHGVLKRLVESGEVEPISHDVRGTLYRWKFQGRQFPSQHAGGTRVPGSTAYVPPPAEGVTYTRSGPGSGMSAREHLRKIVEDEEADLRAKPGAGGDPKPRGEVPYTRSRGVSRGNGGDPPPADGPGAPNLTKSSISVPPPRVVSGNVSEAEKGVLGKAFDTLTGKKKEGK